MQRCVSGNRRLTSLILSAITVGLIHTLWTVDTFSRENRLHAPSEESILHLFTPPPGRQDGGQQSKVCNGCYAWDAPLLLQPSDTMCRDPPQGGAITLLIIVTSRHQNRRHRDILRQVHNGDNTTSQHTRLLFTFGKVTNATEESLLVKESSTHGDVLQIDLIDSYRNLSRIVFNTYQWVVKECAIVKFTAKTTDDVFINTHTVLEMLTHPNMSHTLSSHVFGLCWPEGVAPIRNNKHKSYTSMDAYPFPTYPAYCSGAGTFVHRDVLERIVPASRNIHFSAVHDDVDIGLAAEITGHRVCNVEGMSQSFYTQNRGEGSCNFLQGTFVYAVHLHGWDPQHIRNLFSCRHRFIPVPKHILDEPCSSFETEPHITAGGTS